jgi:DNA phosphorothioation-dependent restriction protein DptH
VSQEFKRVSRADLNVALCEVLVAMLSEALASRQPGHCMKLSDLDRDVMIAVGKKLRETLHEGAQIHVLGLHTHSDDPLEISSSKLVELWNPLPDGTQRPPLLVFVPNELKTAAEDSFAEATFEQFSAAGVYLRLEKYLMEMLPDGMRHSIADLLETVRRSAWYWADPAAVVRFLLSIRINGYDGEVVGASLCELGLIPDFCLLGDPSTATSRLVRNIDCVKTLTYSTKSERGRVLELGLKEKDFSTKLSAFLSETGLEDPIHWTSRIVTEKANRPLSFDKWVFGDGGGFKQKLRVEVLELSLPVIAENESDPRLRSLSVNTPVLAVGKGGPKSFKVTFRSDPVPEKATGVDHFRVQVVARKSKTVLTGFTKRKKKWSGARPGSVSFTNLSKVDWEEGWHFIRVLACTASGDPIPLVDLQGQPIALNGGEDGIPQLNESELFYVVTGDDVDIEVPQRAVPKQPSLNHALIQLRFKALANRRDPGDVRCSHLAWASPESEGQSSKTELLELKFAGEGSVHVPVARALKTLEQRMLETPRSPISWRLIITPGEPNKTTPVVQDWPQIPEVEIFLEARTRFFEKIRGEARHWITQAVDHSQFRDEATDYAAKYLEALTRALRRVETAVADGQSQALADLQKLLALDAVEVVLTNPLSRHRTAVLVGPLHPLRALWLTAWTTLAQHWLDRAKKAREEFIGPTRDALLERLSLVHFPAVLPVGLGRILTAIDSLNPFWTVYGSPIDDDPRGLVGELCTAFGLPEPNLGSFSCNGRYLADRVRRYLVQHPYIQTLTLNCFNSGRGRILAEMLLELEKHPDFQDLRYNIRVFVPDPDAPATADDLRDLISPSSTIAAAEADAFATPTGKHLAPKLTFSIRSHVDFRAAPGNFPAHISMLFDAFPAQEVSAAPARVEDESAAVHGLLQDFTIHYSEIEEIVSWERRPRHGSARPIPDAEDVSSLLASLAATFSSASAAVAINQGGLTLRPVTKLVLDASDRALLHQVHDVSDWVFTIDRSLGIEFFDHDGSQHRPEYLIDHSPDVTANSGRQVVITSRSLMEVRALLERVLHDFGLKQYQNRAAAILSELRVLSGRLALKLVSSPTQRAEALGLALARLFIDYQDALRDQVVVPLDAHLDLYRPLQRNADEFGDEISLRRTDLALFDFDAINMLVTCSLVEVKCYQTAGNLSSLGQLKNSIAEQIQQSERALRHHFDPEFSGAEDRPERMVKTQELIALLEFYVDRASRLRYLSTEAASEAKFFLRRIEQSGYQLRFTRSAILFDFEKTGTEESIEEHGIEFYRIGVDLIRKLLDALPSSADERTGELLTPVRAETAQTTRVEMYVALEKDVPKLARAAFLRERRSRTVSWETLQTPSDEETTTDGGATPRIPIMPRDPSPRSSASVETSPPSEAAGVTTPVPSEGEVPVTGSTRNVANEPLPPAARPEYDVMLGVMEGSPQFGVIGKLHGRTVALDLNETHTISLFGVQGGGKSYTLGSIVEMASVAIPGINHLPSPLATVVFHYSPTQDYRPEFTSMDRPNGDTSAVEILLKEYHARPTALKDIVILAPAEKVKARREEYPNLSVIPLKFASSELHVGHWRFLMGAVGNQATYIRKLNQIMRSERESITLPRLRQAVVDTNLPDALKDLANVRLDLAETYIDDTARLSEVVRPGRLIIVDLRDEFIEKDEALGLFVVLLQLFADASYNGHKFNKLVVFDEAHKYIENPDLVVGLVSVVREMRHKGTSILVASQDPPSVPISLIELSSQIILHRFNSPAWLKHIQKANAALLSLGSEQLARLQPGEAYVWSSKASDPSFSHEAVKIRCRPRVTQHGGATKTAV